MSKENKTHLLLEKDGTNVHVVAEGNVVDLMSSLTYLVGAFYTNLSDVSKEFFDIAFPSAMKDGLYKEVAKAHKEDREE